MISNYRSKLNAYISARESVRYVNQAIADGKKSGLFARLNVLIGLKDHLENTRNELLSDLVNYMQWYGDSLKDIHTDFECREIISINGMHYVATTSMTTVTKGKNTTTYTVTAQKLGYDKTKLWVITWEFPNKYSAVVTDKVVRAQPTKDEPNPEPTVVTAPWNNTRYISVKQADTGDVEEEPVYDNDDCPF